MKKLILAAILPLAGCGVTLDGRIDESERALLDAGRSFAVSQIVAFNEAGFDPLNLKPEHRMYAALGCGVVAQGVVLVTPDPEIAQEIADWCAVFLQAAE